MVNFEQIDDYLSNRLPEQEKVSFERQLEGDPSLREEVEFQRRVVEGVRHARMVQLKTMLNDVPVSGGTSWGGAKIAAAVVSAGVISTLVYLSISSDETKPEELKKEITTELVVEPQKEEIQKTEEITADDKAEAKDETVKTKERLASTNTEKKASVKEEEKIASPVHKPDLNVTDPSSELSKEEKDADVAASTASRSEISVSKMEVITDLDDKKYNFHYQCAQGKLMLYGPFDKSLYEILEIHGDGHAVFLYYKENYYLLDESQTKITQLRAISDSALLKKLREYRGR